MSIIKKTATFLGRALGYLAYIPAFAVSMFAYPLIVLAHISAGLLLMYGGWKALLVVNENMNSTNYDMAIFNSLMKAPPSIAILSGALATVFSPISALYDTLVFAHKNAKRVCHKLSGVMNFDNESESRDMEHNNSNRNSSLDTNETHNVISLSTTESEIKDNKTYGPASTITPGFNANRNKFITPGVMPLTCNKPFAAYQKPSL